MRIDLRADNCLHHGQMLEIIVRLEERIPREELDKDAADTPYIARERPANAKDDLGGSIMTGGNNRRMIFVFKSCRTKVD
jgi:hypothetical protein